MDGPYRAWSEAAQAALARFRPHNTEDTPEGDVMIDVEVVVGKPKKTVKVRPSGDVDNYAKGVYDAITSTGGFWKDDDQIVKEVVMKRWAEPDETPGYHIRITYL